MAPIKCYLLAKLREQYAASLSPARRVIIIGEVVALLGDDLANACRDNHNHGYSCILLRDVSRCLAHV